ncbi:MAG TPA: ParA family protein [Candidatus Nanoarchaeia archaeon]|nr:ParA family protein [Candidatus Nanoarchaeia archaeon]
MRTICVMNHKGGVGKTTTAVNLAAGLSRQDKKVLLIDLDPQSNVGLSLKIDAENTLYDALTGEVSLKQCIVSLAKNFDVITSKESLTKAEYYLSNQPNSKMLLKNLLASVEGYDFVIVDCPPSLGVLNQNVLAFCKEVFVPSSTDFLGFDALQKMLVVVDKINEGYNHDLKITKIIPTMFDKRTKICQETLRKMKELFPGKVSNPIHYNSKLKEAPKYGKSIFKYAKSSSGAKDYQSLVEEVISMGSLRIVQEA